jgi:hypothetical protein
MGSERVFGAVVALALLAALGGCGAEPVEEAILPAPTEGTVNTTTGGVALVAPQVPPEAVFAFKPFADLFAATYAANGESYARAVDATAGEGFAVLDEATLASAFRGQVRRQYYLDTGGGATNRYTEEVVGAVMGTPEWRLESTGGALRYARYGFRTVDGIAQICLNGQLSRCGAAFVDDAGTLGVMWERLDGGVTGWVYGPPAGTVPVAPGTEAAE